MKSLHLLALVLAVSFPGLTGCGRTPKDKPLIGIVSNNTAEFWRIVEIGAKKAADQFNVELTFRKPSNATAAEQKQYVDELLTKGVKGLAISVIDAPNQAPFLDSIVDRGVPLLTQDNDAPNTKRLCYIGTDNYKAGQAVGQLVKEALPNGGTVAIFVGQMEGLNAQKRHQGVLDELAGVKDAKGPMLGKYKLHGLGEKLGPFTDNVDEKIAKENADQVLVKLQNEKDVCLIGLWAYNPPAIYAAVQSAKKEGIVKIVGFDEDKTTLQGIKVGHIQGTVAQQPYEFGYKTIEHLSYLARGDRSKLPSDGLLYIDHIVVRRDNVEAFQQALQAQIGMGN